MCLKNLNQAKISIIALSYQTILAVSVLESSYV